MKVIFFLDSVDEKGNILEPNVRALEIDPIKLQLREISEGVTVLSYPLDAERSISLLSFAVSLRNAARPVPPPAPDASAPPAQPVPPAPRKRGPKPKATA